MSFLKRFRDALRSTPSSRATAERVTSAPPPPDAPEEAKLRATLEENPNDVPAFARLAEIVRRRAAEVAHPDPLSAEAEPVSTARAEDTAHWALAEELAGRPHGWYPLIELARLSLSDDKEGAMRRLSAACERETEGKALVEGIKMLRAAHLPAEALGLGVGHWSPSDQDPEAGRQIVEAALDAGRVSDARRHLSDLAEFGSTFAATPRVVAELEPFVAAAEAEADSATSQ
ncbi:hypothetical protein [Ruania halotolerans]|uniref:hypothetical protein n=1 Tax=Ruania halotolerans TaxID=2897773 RepID=UPI001E55B5DA|nr:hypothetical protein [Ruania halotolerans]UFU04896.1 hypothetical protein LQF10_10410 [Ruania halotolerans]